MSTNSAVVVIPIYKQVLNENEQWSLKQGFDVLIKHNIVFVKPESLDISNYISLLDGRSFLVESFDDNFFEDVRGYNRLMLSAHFYDRFSSYAYMLIYQLDAFVFKDDLQHWCEQGYDYIGAPWIFRQKLTRTIRSFFHYRFNWKQRNSKLPTLLQFYNRVGNGGFSLRRIRKFSEICSTYRSKIDFYNERNDISFFNEDVFWSLEINRQKKVLNIPDFKKALHFSIDQTPNVGLNFLKGELPFGIHAWHHYPEVWQSIMILHSKY